MQPSPNGTPAGPSGRAFSLRPLQTCSVVYLVRLTVLTLVSLGGVGYTTE